MSLMGDNGSLVAPSFLNRGSTVPVPGQARIRVPSKATLKKYGLSLKEWRSIVQRQGGRCGACGRVPGSGRLVIDHEHVRGYRKLPPEKRRLYVRGLLDWTCNHYRLGKGATVDNLRGSAEYLERYYLRKRQAERAGLL